MMLADIIDLIGASSCFVCAQSRFHVTQNIPHQRWNLKRLPRFISSPLCHSFSQLQHLHRNVIARGTCTLFLDRMKNLGFLGESRFLTGETVRNDNNYAVQGSKNAAPVPSRCCVPRVTSVRSYSIAVAASSPSITGRGDFRAAELPEILPQRSATA